MSALAASSVDLSLVIATLSDDGDLEHCLASLTAQVAAPTFEVIVVDQNGDDRVSSVIDRFSDRLAIIHEQVAFRCASRARNFGARLAKGRWLGFPDDDCRLLPDTLQLVGRLAADQRMHLITGQTIDDRGQPNLLNWRRKSIHFTHWTMMRSIIEATIFVRRECFMAAGGFDERFGPGGAYPASEGVDLVNRLLAELDPGQARYDPSIRMQHPTKTLPWSRWSVGRFHSYGIGAGAAAAKNLQPHMLYFWVRALVAAVARIPSRNIWKSLAYMARLAGLIRGFFAFSLARITCRG